MIKIVYTVGKESGVVQWAASEQFNELVDRQFNLNEMEAKQIEKLDDLSITAKILLSAVAGAVIQHLLDAGIESEVIFNNGSFVIKK